VGAVATNTGSYLDTHPQTNQALTTIAQQQAGPQSLAALKTYFDANPQAGGPPDHPAAAGGPVDAMQAAGQPAAAAHPAAVVAVRRPGGGGTGHDGKPEPGGVCRDPGAAGRRRWRTAPGPAASTGR
jgi:hypothetical protein